MSGPVTYARHADAASVARHRLDAAAEAMAAVESAQRSALAALLELWPTSAWLAAGATSAKRWLLAYTHCSEPEAHRLERAAGLCHRHPTLADQGRAEDWGVAVRFWAERVDEERALRQVPRHNLSMTQRLFGGGEVHADLSPSAFLNVAAAIDAWTDDPDPKAAPHRRPLGERRADALDDLCAASLRSFEDTTSADPGDDLLTGGPRADDPADTAGSPTADDVAADDTFDGWAPTDDLDEALAGLRDVDDLDDLVLRGDGWRMTKEAAERLLCDTAMVAVLFDGKGHILDANDDAERWSPRQRRAIAARDRHCVFPSCTRPPRHCDVHHLHHAVDGGPTKTANGALLCRFHHRLLHEYGWTLSVIHGRWVARDRHGNAWTGRPRAPDPATAKTPR